MTLAEQLIAVADAYREARGISRARLSTIVLNQGRRLDLIAAGDADLATGTWERAMRWFADNWPEGADWPAGIDRPPASVAPAAGPAPACARQAEAAS